MIDGKNVKVRAWLPKPGYKMMATAPHGWWEVKWPDGSITIVWQDYIDFI